MIIRKGLLNDINEIMTIIREATTDMDFKGIYQWDHIYPNEEVLKADLEQGNLYVSQNEDNFLQGIIVLNETQDNQYNALNWQFNSGKQLIIHRLCIHPLYQGKGVARALVKFAEEYGKEQGYGAIRLDAFIKNPVACKLYEGLGYSKIGVVAFRKGDFYCYEKVLI